MTKSSLSSQKKELAALPLARIETMDTSYTMPLREYLFTNGCQVFVNSGPTENVTYFFVVGDSSFVKKTLAFRHDIGKKQLIICWDTEDHESIEQFIGKNTKIAYVDPVVLSTPFLIDLFTFFFTAKGKELNAQKRSVKNYHPPKEEGSTTHDDIVELTNTVEDEPLAPASSYEYEKIEKKRISNLIGDMFGQTTPAPEHTNTPSEESPKVIKFRKPKKHIGSLLGVAILITILLCLSPFLLYIGSISIRSWELFQSSKNFKNGKGALVLENIKRERLWSGYTHLTTPLVHGVLRVWVGEKTIQTYERIDRLLDVMTDVEEELLTMNDAILSMGGALLLEQNDKQPLTPVVAVDTIRKNMPSIRNKLDLAASYLQTFNEDQGFPFTIPLITDERKKISDKITKYRQVGEVGERIAQLYPFFGGFRNKERILVLLQNSSELRPTGGFIGSLAHLTVSEGILEEMKINDVYDLDGQLKGHIDPPTPIKELLNQEHWYLRDSNWNPNFQTTAEKVGLFYEKETGERVESIIGITSSFVVRILKIIGPVEIPFYKDRITADNFYLKSLYYTQANFFPGSTQKKDFLGALMEAILLKLQKDPQSGIAIMEIIHDSLASKDIQWYTTHEDGQRALAQFGWAGSVPAGNSCLLLTNKLSCLFSYIYINEANMSVNKVNSFVDRSEARSFQISEEGTTQETITRKIQNASQGESGTGVYTTYIRIFFPENSTLTNLTLDGVSIPMRNQKITKQPLPYGELDTTLPGLIGVGVAFEVDPGRERVLSASILHGQTILKDNKEGIITFFEQKQAGVDQVDTTTTVSFPPSWTATPIPSSGVSRVVAKPGYLEYNTKLLGDTEYSVHFMR